MIKKLICEECGERFDRDLLPWTPAKDIFDSVCESCVQKITDRGRRRAAQEKRMANVSRKLMYDCPSCRAGISLDYDRNKACPVCQEPLTDEDLDLYPLYTEEELFGTRSQAFYRNVGEKSIVELMCVPLCDGCAADLEAMGLRVFEKLQEAPDPCEHTFPAKARAAMQKESAPE